MNFLNLNSISQHRLSFLFLFLFLIGTLSAFSTPLNDDIVTTSLDCNDYSFDGTSCYGFHGVFPPMTYTVSCNIGEEVELLWKFDTNADGIVEFPLNDEWSTIDEISTDSMNVYEIPVGVHRIY